MSHIRMSIHLSLIILSMGLVFPPWYCGRCMHFHFLFLPWIETGLFRSCSRKRAMMSPSSRVRKPRRSYAELMKLPWRRMKVWKLEDKRKSGAAMVFREALK